MATPETDIAVSPEDHSSGNGEPDTSIEEFNRRVEKLMEMIEADPRVRDRLLAELYVNFANVEMMFRGMLEMMQKEGISGMMKGFVGRKRKDKE